MLKIYCSECGSPTEYSVSKPKFCSSCGYSFLSPQKQNIIVSPAKVKQPIQVLDEEDFDDETNTIPDINNLSFDLDFQMQKKEKLGKILGSSKGEENLLRKNASKEKINKKKVLEDFTREAGAIKPSTRTATQTIKNRKGKKDG